MIGKVIIILNLYVSRAKWFLIFLVEVFPFGFTRDQWPGVIFPDLGSNLSNTKYLQFPLGHFWSYAGVQV